jgi:putative transposase
MMVRLAWDLILWCGLLLRPREPLEAEILFLRRQLALYRERGAKPRRVGAATRATLTCCRDVSSGIALCGGAAGDANRLAQGGLRALLAMEVASWTAADSERAARADPTDGRRESRVGFKSGSRTSCKLGLRVSPRPVAKYMPRPAPGRPRGGQRWSTFLRNHARDVIACDFLVAVTTTFRVLYVLVVIEHHSRRLIHLNVTAQPTAQWTRQQLREAVGYEERYEYLLHDRDAIFSVELDESIRRLGLRVLKSLPRSSKANAICERVIGTIRRECLDWIIPFSEANLRQTLKAWVTHYNRGRPHTALGPGVPDPPASLAVPLSSSRHRLDDFCSVHTKGILGGLHHEYSLARA